MDNIELEQRILEIIQTENFFDMIIKAKEFEKEYKTSDFYKITKMPLNDVIKSSKIYYAIQLKDLGNAIQKIINNLSFENVSEVLDKLNETFSAENEEIKDSLEVLKVLKN